MVLFLGSFFVIYGFLHLFIFLRFRKAFRIQWRVSIAVSLFMALMWLAPVITFRAERTGMESLAIVMSWAGYIWMAEAFLFTVISAVWIIILSSLRGTGLRSFRISAKASFIVPLIMSLTICAYGYLEASNIRVERVTMHTEKLPAAAGRLRIVQISDVHLGLIVRGRRLRGIVDKVKAADPDILVSTGDLVDGLINRLDGLSDILNEIRPRYGKYAITGNHEYYAGIDQALAFTRKAGFTVLQGKAVTLPGVINIAGVNDPTSRYYGNARNVGEHHLLASLDRSFFTLLLKHRPELDKDSSGLFDLQLSGHTHRGQIFPFTLIPAMIYKYTNGLYDAGDGGSLYVSRGSGTWGPPIRFLSPPEIAVIDVLPAEGQP